MTHRGRRHPSDLWPLPPALERVYLDAPDVAGDLLRTTMAEGFYLAERLDYNGHTSAGWAVLASWLTYAAQQTPADDLAGHSLARMAHAATDHAGRLMRAHLAP